MRKNNITMLRCSFLLMLVFNLLLISCQKEETNNRSSNDGSFVVFTALGIQDDDTDADGMMAKNNMSIARSSSYIDVKKDEFDNISLELSVEESSYTNRSRSNLINNSDKINVMNLNKAVKYAANKNMQNGIKYVVLLYDYNSGAFVASKTITVGSNSEADNGRVILIPNARYSYYAYSYNSSTIDIPSDYNNPTVTSRINAPFLYTSGDFTLSGNDITINLLFKHKISKIELMVDGRKAHVTSYNFLTINIPSIELVYHDFNLKNGNRVEGTKGSVAQTNVALNFTNPSSPNASPYRLSSNALYTSTTEGFSLTAQCSALDIKIDEDIVLINGTSTYPTRTLAFPSFVGESDHHIKRAIFSFNTPTGLIFNGLEWSPGNLYYDDAANIDYRYKFSAIRVAKPGRKNYDPINFYWNFMSNLPHAISYDREGVNVINTGDPCLKVFPLGEWRTPTIADYEAFYESSSVSKTWNATDNWLQLSYGGKSVYFWETGNIKKGTRDQFDSRDGYGDYRTSTQQSPQSEVSFFQLRVASNNQSSSSNWFKEQISGIYTPNTDHKYNGMAVRCVRDITPIKIE